MINFIYLHRGSVLPVMHGVLILKRSDGFSVLCDEWLNDGSSDTKPEEKKYTMYELQLMHEKATGEQCFFIWDEGKKKCRI